MGLDLQFCGREVSVEVSTAYPVPGAGDIRRATAGDRDFHGGAASGAKPGCGGVRAAQEAHAHASALIRAHGAAACVALRDGRRANATAEFLCGSGAHAVRGATLANALARPGYGRHSATAVDSRSPGESGGDADGQSAGEFE